MKGHFQCGKRIFFIENSKVCDGNYDCPQGEDEFYCIENQCPYGCKCSNKLFLYCVNLILKLRNNFFKIAIFKNVSLRLERNDLKNYLTIFLKLENYHLNSSNDISVKISTFQNLRDLIINHIFFEISDKIYISFPNYLQNLEISNTNIKTFNENSFKYLNLLFTLNLTSNSLVKIHNVLFKNLRNLRKLILNKNHIKFIEKSSFKNLIRLKELIFRNSIKLLFDHELFHFKYIHLVKKFYFDNNLYCCAINYYRGGSSNNITCSWSYKIIQNCKNLFPIPSIGYLFTCFSSIHGIFQIINLIFFFLMKKNLSSREKIFICHDITNFCYLLLIIFINYNQTIFFQYYYNWQSKNFCLIILVIEFIIFCVVNAYITTDIIYNYFIRYSLTFIYFIFFFIFSIYFIPVFIYLLSLKLVIYILSYFFYSFYFFIWNRV